MDSPCSRLASSVQHLTEKQLGAAFRKLVIRLRGVLVFPRVFCAEELLDERRVTAAEVHGR